MSKAIEDYRLAHAGFLGRLEELGLAAWGDMLYQGLAADYENVHGDMRRWMPALEALPRIPGEVDLLNGVAVAGDSDMQPWLEHLHQFKPWRKGPFQLEQLHLNTEWRSDWKWDRVVPHIADLRDRLVLDIGCGNGYYGWRMLGRGARYVVGVDPMRLFMMQFRAIRKMFCLDDAPIDVLPLRAENLAPSLAVFDTVFSMGVLYHRKDPVEHLQQLLGALRPGGEVVLETLVLEDHNAEVLVPPGRYAQMGNVWAVPPVPVLEAWMREAGFVDVRAVDVSVTSLDEQRATDWMVFQSLADFLDADDRSLTAEGHPAPVRAVIIANRPQ